MTDFAKLIKCLCEAKIDFIVVGGAAAIAHGASRMTQDLDIVYSRSEENLKKIVKALNPLSPYLRGIPAGLPFQLDLSTMKAGLNFTLTTSIGELDLLGEIIGSGSYESLKDQTVTFSIFSCDVRCLDLETLIRTKKAVGRPKDIDAVSELEEILSLQDSGVK